jgi:hypothetical protein
MSPMLATSPRVEPNHYSSASLLGVLAVSMAALGLVKFSGLVVKEGPANAPWLFLLVLVVPFLVGRWVLRTRPRAGAVVIGVMASLLGALSIAVLVTRTLQPYWGDYLVVFVGGPLALVAVVLAVRVIRGR